MRNKTKICCFDVQEDIVDYLNTEFDVYDGSYGVNVNIQNEIAKGRVVPLLVNYDFPENLHEYDIFISELHNNEEILYKRDEHTHCRVVKDSAICFGCEYPTTLFNPKAFGSERLRANIKSHNRFTIHIIFQGEETTVNYRLYNEYMRLQQEYNFSNYEFISKLVGNTISGQEVTCTEDDMSHILFDKFLEEIKYLQTFEHPSIWNHKDQREEKDTRFKPLLLNKLGNVVSFIWLSDNEFIIVLPQLKSKLELLKLVFKEVLFPYFSDYFPTITEGGWINKKEYYLPNKLTLIDKRDHIIEEYKRNLEEIDKAIAANDSEYNFLHNLLTATGSELVKSVIHFLKWLGFDNVRDQDEFSENELLEEDIQVDLENGGLLVIEVKGINGTSKDAECSQISKVRRRREKQRDKFDVSALYIVNHQRCIEPIKREMPPFNTTQIQDAINDDRGLAYTWQLFNLYFNIENGLISKEEARMRLLSKGLVDFNPILTEIGIPYTYYHHNTVACVNVGDKEIRKGDTLAYEVNGRYFLVAIEDLQIDHTSYPSVKSAKAGIKLSSSVPNKHTLYLVNDNE